ncbi:MAG: hypothetical protein ACTHMS_15885 [Jatrophihabitans sp.]|uniref:hypothetical protein n=1 Tax=Jatrophihabitans sp. TaxID=1932789 RepID=UPI003F7E0674
MSDLVVDFEELEHSQQALEKIKNEFEHTTKRVDGIEDIWSDDAVRDAMHDFAHNWKDHREKLIGKMDDAYKHSQACLNSFRATEEKLASALDVHPTGGGGRVTAR